mmetsp:Transcript_69697/g.157587  ORF Transcript_69697/g.157587 Transcript_69697/m.157587 type:complete len:226 (+) Transcript_69697:404-1081(+)
MRMALSSSKQKSSNSIALKRELRPGSAAYNLSSMSSLYPARMMEISVRLFSATVRICPTMPLPSLEAPGSSACASSMNKTPPMACAMRPLAKSPPSRRSSSPVVSTKVADRTPRACMILPYRRATVVLPVPGFPKKVKLVETATFFSSGTDRSDSTVSYKATASSFTLRRPWSPNSWSMGSQEVPHRSRASTQRPSSVLGTGAPVARLAVAAEGPRESRSSGRSG